MSTVRRHDPRRVAGRWSVRLILALVVLAQLLACQAVPAPGASASTAVVQNTGHDIGHDIVCEADPPALAIPQMRNPGPDYVPPLGAAVVLATLTATSAGLAGRTRADGMPSWAPRRLVAGRHRLLAIGLTRV